MQGGVVTALGQARAPALCMHCPPKDTAATVWKSVFMSQGVDCLQVALMGGYLLSCF